MDVQTELQKFIATYTGRNDVGDTPENTGQCVGLIEKWIDLFAQPHIWGNAKDLLTNADPNFYEIILNTPDNYPQAGDIVVWNENWGNGYGHTAVVVSADVNQFSSFEQNDHATSDPSGLCEILNHNYTNVKGWIRFKNLLIRTITPSATPIQTTVTETISLAEYTKLQIQYDTVKQQLDSIQSTSQPEINNYHAMQALGYNTVDDITNALQKKEDLILKLQQEQVILEKDNEALHLAAAENSKNNYTGMEEGIKAVARVSELEDYILQVQKAAGINLPKPRNVISRILHLKDLSDKYLQRLEDENKLKAMQRQAVTSIQQVQQNGVEWLMTAFRLHQKEKGVN